MIELRRRRYPDPWGRSSHGDEDGAAGGDDRRRSRVSRTRTIGRAARSWPSRATSIGSGCATMSSSCLAIGRPSDVAEPSGANGRPAGQSHSVSSRTSRTSASRIPTIPYKHPDYFQAWAAVGVLSSGSSSRLFTEVREKRGLVLHGVCVAAHAARPGQRAVLRRHDGRAGAGNARRDGRRAAAARRGHRAERTGPAQGADQELAHHAAGIDQRPQRRDWPATGIIWAGRGRSTKLAGWSTQLSAETINAFLKANPPQRFAGRHAGPEPLELPAEAA